MYFFQVVIGEFSNDVSHFCCNGRRAACRFMEVVKAGKKNTISKHKKLRQNNTIFLTKNINMT